jgi:hypothetical protein
MPIALRFEQLTGIESGETIADISKRSRMEAESLGHHGQTVPQGQVAFLNMVSDFTAFERREQWIGDPAPSHRLPLLQLVNFPSERIRLSHGLSARVTTNLNVVLIRNRP